MFISQMIPLKMIPRSTNTEKHHWVIVLSSSSGSYTLICIIVIEQLFSETDKNYYLWSLFFFENLPRNLTVLESFNNNK